MNANVFRNELSFTGAMCLLFVGLKLSGNIDWPWWWVTAPIWIEFLSRAFWNTADFIAKR